MIDIKDKNTVPTFAQIRGFADCGLLEELIRTLEAKYSPSVKIEYSRDNVLPGWNVKFKKSSKTLCTVYPRPGCFNLLLVVGAKEKVRTEELLPSFSAEFVRVYESTKEGMGQRWLLFDFPADTNAYGDILKVINIRSGKDK